MDRHKLPLEQRLQELHDRTAARKAKIALRKRRIANKNWWRKNRSAAALRSAAWHARNAAAKQRRIDIDARRSARLAKKAAKEEAQRLRLEARKRKSLDPVKAWADAFRKGVEAGRILERQDAQQQK